MNNVSACSVFPDVTAAADALGNVTILIVDRYLLQLDIVGEWANDARVGSIDAVSLWRVLTHDVLDVSLHTEVFRMLHTLTPDAEVELTQFGKVDDIAALQPVFYYFLQGSNSNNGSDIGSCYCASTLDTLLYLLH